MTKRLISFSDPQYETLRAESKELGISVSELVRRIIDAHYEKGDTPEAKGDQ